MTKKEFSTKILKCSDQHWRYILAGERNLSIKKAKLVSQLLSTDVLVWMDSEQVHRRKAAWKQFSGEEK